MNNLASESQTITNVAGDLMVAIAYSGQNTGGGEGGTSPNMTFTVSDTNGNTYYAGPMINNNKYNSSAIQIFYAMGIHGGANTVTATTAGGDLGGGGNGSWTGLWLQEYSGVATSNAVDVSSSQMASSVTTVGSPGNMTTTTPCDLVIGASVDGHMGSQSMTPNAGFTISSSDTWDPGAAVDDRGNVITSAGTVVSAVVNYTSADDGWTATQIAFRGASTASPPQPTQLAITTSTQSLNTYDCSGAVTVQSQNGSAQATTTSTGITLNLTGSTLTYYADSSCRFPITSAYIGAGSSSSTFYFTSTTVGTPTITVNATGFTQVTQSETIAGNNNYVWIGGGSCSPVNWATGACWQGGSAPGSSNTAHFDATCTSNCSPTIAAGITVGGIWLHSGYTGTITQGTATITSNGDVELDSGTLTVVSSTVTYKKRFTVAGGTYNAGSAATNLKGGITISSGTFNGNSAPISATGVQWTYTGGTVNMGTSSVSFNDLNALSILINSGAMSFNDVNLSVGNDGCGSAVVTGTMNIGGNLNLNNVGTCISIDGGTIALSGNLTQTAGGFAGNGSAAIQFVGGGAQTYTYVAGVLPAGAVTVNKTAGSTLTLNSDLTLNSSGQTLTVTSGTLDLNAHNLTVKSTLKITDTLNGSSGTITAGGAWWNNGTFNAGTGTVLLTEASHTFTGATTFNNLTLTMSGGTSRSLTFPASMTQTVSGTLTLSGTSSAVRLRLRSLTAGTQFTLNATGTTSTQFLDVKDSNAQTPISIGGGAGTSLNSGNNTGWTFP
jgi:hypothetical protein